MTGEQLELVARSTPSWVREARAAVHGARDAEALALHFLRCADERTAHPDSFREHASDARMLWLDAALEVIR